MNPYLGLEPVGEYGDEIIEPIAVEEVEIVGIVVLPGQVLPDELFRRAEMIVSPELSARYDCVPDIPRPGATFAEAVAALLPADCAVAFPYYSLRFADGAPAVQPALDEFVDRAARLNGGLANVDWLDEGVELYSLIPTEAQLEAQRVERTVQPIVAALVLLAMAAVAVTLVLLALAVSRELRRSRSDQRQWRELAVGLGGRALVVGLPPVAAAIAGSAVGTVAGYLLAPGPIGQVQVIEPDAERQLGLPVIGTAVAVALLAIAISTLLALRSSGRSSSDAPAMTRAARSVPATIGSPGRR